jgi:hypothetical protein
LEQPPFPREREFGFYGHYLKGGFVAQEAEVFVAMNVAHRLDAWYWRHDKRGNREPRQQDTGIVETNASLSSGLTKVLASMVEAGDLKSAQQSAQAAGEAGMAELAARTGYEPAFITLHPDAYGTLSFHFGLWPVDREKRCLIGRSAGGKRGRRGLRELGHAFISLLRHDAAIGLPDHLVLLPKKNLAERDSDDWAASVAMDRKLRDELMKLSNGEELLEQADEFQKVAAEDWLERFYATGEGAKLLKAERDKALEKLRRRKLAAERMARIKMRRMEEERHAAGVKLAEQGKTIKAALQLMGAKSETDGSEPANLLVKRSAQVISERDQARAEISGAENELKQVTLRLAIAEERITTLEDEATQLRRIKTIAKRLAKAILAKSVKLSRKTASLFSQLVGLLDLSEGRVEDRTKIESEEPRM